MDDADKRSGRDPQEDNIQMSICGGWRNVRGMIDIVRMNHWNSLPCTLLILIYLPQESTTVELPLCPLLPSTPQTEGFGLLIPLVMHALFPGDQGKRAEEGVLITHRDSRDLIPFCVSLASHILGDCSFVVVDPFLAPKAACVSL